ncbi:hypothetical protein Vadar_014540 [Vaccinium darrowii]|uniref:Uncharacterized protein n=1 Tax=Vaccinium darrowii TaxID=229202 RepID=A0ACB7XHU7_9ERIC|nr:hypothetical protein Vadar_014540 [Vaccinium darrowii]
MVIFLLLLFCLLSAGAGARANEHDRNHDEECMPTRCGDKGPEIRFPFWLKDRQPDRCGYGPDFALTCSDHKETLFDIAFPAKAVVEEIDYRHQYITCKFSGCVPITDTFSFQTYTTFEQHVFNCPSSVNPYDEYTPLPCLSRQGHNLYSLHSYSLIRQPLLNCTKMYTIGSYQDTIPGTLDSVASSNWANPKCLECEAVGKYCRLSASINDSRKHETECFDIPNYLPRDVTKSLLVKGLIPPGLFLLVVLVIATYFVHRSKNKKKEDQVKVERFLNNYRVLKPTRFTYAEIKKITRNLKYKLGQGGYGTVYKGELSNGVLVAAKILNNFTGNGDDFINEVGTIGTIHHINVIRLVGYCADGYKKALVYEYLPYDSLDKYISSDRYICLLGWEKLQDIAIGIAKGIEYLHQGCDQTILHFDIKPHNILFDKKFVPKISDFGLAKLCSKEISVVSMTAARGTVGYIAPEVFSRNFDHVSHKSDVYSFGMLLLEIVGGRKKNVDVHTEENSDEAYFPEWIYKRLNREEVKNNEVEGGRDAKIVKKLTIVGLWCIQWCPGGRPSMKVVVQMLEGNGETLAMPPNPFSTSNPSITRGNVGGSPFSSMLDIISESD